MKKRKKKGDEVVVVLHNIRSTHNVGSIFRTSDAAGVSKIYLTGYTPTPLDRFGRVRADIHKTALGAEESLVWEQVKRVGPLLKRLKRQGFFCIAVEQADGAVDYKKITRPKDHPCVIIFGNEVRGISPSILKMCDVVAEIPMHGKKESLNVSVSAGIALFRILNR